MGKKKYPKKRFGPIVKIPMEVLQAQKKKNTTTGYTLDPGQRAANLEKKFNRSWHQTFTNFGSLFDSFKGPK
jgi:hypothetical protein